MLRRLMRMITGKNIDRDRAQDLYSDIVMQARQPFFYQELRVPDTVEGRFDMITLHMFLVLKRLKEDVDPDPEFSQMLFDVMFKNMDDSFREMGVGDLSVGKKVRKLAEDFYGRVGVYEIVFADEDGFGKALARNIIGDEGAVEGQYLASYSKVIFENLKNEKLERFKLGIISFTSPEKLNLADAVRG